MMEDNALRVAGGAGGVVEGDRVPLIARHGPVRSGVALSQECLVLCSPKRSGSGQVVNLYQRRPATELRERWTDDRGALAISNQQPCLAMRQDESDGAGIETIVQRVENSACHRHAVMRLEQRRDVRRYDGDGVSPPDA